MGSTDPNTPIANGWLRVSHRRLDPRKSTPYRPYHPHDRVEPLAPGLVYECDVEIVTSCIVVPAGWRVALTVRGKDYEYEGEVGEFARKFHYGTRGTGGMPRPPWILLAAETHVGDQGTGVAHGLPSDREGFFGRCEEALIFERRP